MSFIIVDELGVNESAVTKDAHFVDDLGADSLDTVELVLRFEQEFGIEIPDEEAEKRSIIFKERIAPWIEDFGKLWSECIDELESLNKPLKAFDLKSASNIELREYFDRVFNSIFRSWNIHFVSMYAVYSIYNTFEKMCRDTLDIDGNHPDFKKLMSGFKNKFIEKLR